MKKLFEKMGKFGYVLIGVLFAVIIVAVNIVDIYTWIVGISWRACGFDGYYVCEDDSAQLAVYFEDNEMVMYMTDNISCTRISYNYEGRYYNNGLFGKFLTHDKKWIEIEDADKAGSFYADCKTCVYTNGWGEFEYLDENQIEAIGKEKDINYSKVYYFKTNGDLLYLNLVENDEQVTIPLKKVARITGELGETIEYLDTLWEYHFAEE